MTDDFGTTPAATEPEAALAWHRECTECGTVLTVSFFDLNTEDPTPHAAPTKSPCMCGANDAGPWVAGEHEGFDDGDETDEMRCCSECDEGYAHSYVCTRCSSESYQNDDGFMCDQKLHEPCRVCDYGTVHALVAPGYEK